MARDSGRPHTLPFQYYLTPSPTLSYGSSVDGKHLGSFTYYFCLALSLSFLLLSFPLPFIILPSTSTSTLIFPFPSNSFPKPFPSFTSILPFPFLLLLLLLLYYNSFLFPFLFNPAFSFPSLLLSFPTNTQPYIIPFVSPPFPLHYRFAAVLDINSHYCFPSFPFLFIIKSTSCFQPVLSFSYIQLKKFFQKKFFHSQDYPHKVFPNLTPVFFTPT